MQDGALSNDHVLITGASRGIGAAIAHALHAEGAKVSLAARTWGPDAPAGARMTRHVADVTSEASLAACLAAATAEFGPVTILVNNAGGVETAPITRTDSAMLRRILALNLESVFTLTRLVVPSMLERRRGRIINVASTAGLKGYPYVSAYTAAKHGVIGMTRALAQELARTGVTINAVCPGYTETELVREAVATIMTKTGRSEAEARAELTKANPQGRMVTPEEVAGAVVYLAGPLAAAVNGIALGVSGGETG
jgi:NAD(P)-dependent dehydrogenase (short-subunit alcohol dehydrogenase family)